MRTRERLHEPIPTLTVVTAFDDDIAQAPDAADDVRAPAPLAHVIGRALVIVGIVGLLFGFFQVVVGGITERRAQRTLKGAFVDQLSSGVPLGAGKDGKLHAITRGTAVALLEIPDIGVRKFVVEGTDAEQLKRGPGHLPNSFLPGQPGHAVIVGRRTTYGAPFKRLDLLRTGDEIYVTTPYGRFPFRVRKAGSLAQGKADQLASSENGLLTLATSDPAYAPHSALVVEAELTSDPSTFDNPPLGRGREGALSFVGNVGALPVAALTGSLLFGAIAAAQVLYRRWQRWPTWLITTPVILALAFAWMDALTSLLPSTL